MFIFGSTCIKMGIDKTIKNQHIYSYNVQKNNLYEVELKPNKFYECSVLPSEYCYASQSINNINMNFRYKFNANHKANINYNYNITAELVGKVENNEKEIWNKSCKLIEDNCEKQEYIDEVCVDKKVCIDYKEYNNLVQDFEKEYGIKINAILKVKLNVCFNINSIENNLQNEKIEDCIETEIPITNTVTEVIKKYEDTNSNMIDKSIVEVTEIVFYIVGGLLELGVIIIIIRLIIKNKKSNNINEKYKKRINKILKYYKEIIVEIESEICLESKDIIYVKKLEDLIDIAEQNKCCILYYKANLIKESKWYVILDKYIFLYKMKK